MSTILSLVQGTSEWHEHRVKYRNASETPAIMGASPWLSPLMVWELKTGRRVQEINYAMQRGTELEPKARAAYEQETGLVMEPVVMVEGNYSASLDGVSLAGDLILEVKCPVQGRRSETWKAAEAGKVPPHYVLQVQHQLMVSKAALAHFYVFDGESGITVEVLPDQEAMDDIQQAWNRFMEFILTDSPPPLTAMDTIVREDHAWKRAAEKYLASKEAAEEAATQAELAKAGLVALAQHSSERGFGVSVSKFWKGNSGKQEVRVATTRQGGQPC